MNAMKTIMQYIIGLLVAWLISTNMSAQTVVRLSVPTQADERLQVVVLFDEEIPEGMPVVLGLMGYDVTGGMEPFTYEWVKNGNVIGTGDVVIFKPAKGDKLSLKVKDKNQCYSTTDFNLKIIRSIKADEQEDNIRIYPTVIPDGKVHIVLPFTPNETDEHDTQVRIFNMEGKILNQYLIRESTDLQLELPVGNYFISVKSATHHLVEKIIIQL